MENSIRGNENSFFSSNLIHFTTKAWKVRLVSLPCVLVITCFPEMWKQPVVQHASFLLPEECHFLNASVLEPHIDL